MYRFQSTIYLTTLLWKRHKIIIVVARCANDPVFLMFSTPLTCSALFFSGIHVDYLGRLEAPAKAGVSNPGKFTSMAGGASLNSASIARLLGLPCAIIGLIGDDRPGAMLKDILKERDITDLTDTRRERSTGSYTSIIEPDGNLNIAVADLGLNEEVSAGWLLDTHGSTMSSADIWFVNSNLSSATLVELCERNGPMRPKILAAASISPSKAKNLIASLTNIDVLFTNIAEANALLETKDGRQLDAQQCISQFIRLGIKQGSLSQGDEMLFVWDEDKISSFSPPKISTVTDVTGAGDALAGVFLAGLAHGGLMVQIAPLAIAAAQMTLAATGPYNADINPDSLRALNEKTT